MINILAKDEDKVKYSQFVLRSYIEDNKMVILQTSSAFIMVHVMFLPFMFIQPYCIHKFIYVSCHPIYSDILFMLCCAMILIISCRQNGVQLQIVLVQWSFLVMGTMMSHASANSASAGM